jgi:hypothetical protein
MLRKGQKVQELTKKIGQAPRTGVVLRVDAETVEVRWDDGRVTSVTGAYLRPVRSNGHK